LSKVSLALVIHSHQPVGNFDHVIEDAYQKSYAPFVHALYKHPAIRLSLHFSGILLEWLEKRHPEYFQQLRELTARGQIELVGGGYYEPILPIIPDADKIAQLRKLADYLRKHFGASPRGAWIAERVWEPTLPLPLAKAGVEYVVLDDTHFLAAGLQPWQLHGSFITDEDGHAVRLIPSVKSLRYTIPFQDPAETVRILREGINQPNSLFAMGDDCEKFGVWPGTYDHVYKNGWLEKFLTLIESCQDWLETTTIADYLSSHPPVGRIYLPTASYAEMMEWSLPPAASTDLKSCMEESEHIANGEQFQRFLRGGFWRNFLSKYPESNQMQKQALRVSHQLQKADGSAKAGTEKAGFVGEARTHLMSAQCNDPYWHGVFGGLYSPHLRSANLRHLVEAETLLDQAEGRGPHSKPEVESTDFDFDGQEEILIQQSLYGMVLRPADGGTVSSLRFKPAHVELVNSLMRRPEAYHSLVRKHVSSKSIAPIEGPASVHDLVIRKGSHLEELLRYDRYARHGFRTYLFPGTKSWQDFDYLRLEENADLAGGAWKATPHRSRAGVVELRNASHIRGNGCSTQVEAVKTLTSKVSGSAWHIECRSSFSTDHSCPADLATGLEMVFNLLAPDAPDRYFLANQIRRSLDFRGEIDSPELVLVDEWQGVKITLHAQPRARWWIVPIETISQSESGFERVYQGSAILAVWKIDPPSWRNMTCSIEAEIAQWEKNIVADGGNAGGA
jgi:4-alpha-glucanotransferase